MIAFVTMASDMATAVLAAGGVIVGTLATGLMAYLREEREARRRRDERDEDARRRRLESYSEQVAAARCAFFVAYDDAHRAAQSFSQVHGLKALIDSGGRRVPNDPIHERWMRASKAFQEAHNELRRHHTRLLLLEPDLEIRRQITEIQACLGPVNTLLVSSDNPAEIWEAMQRDLGAHNAGYQQLSRLLEHIALLNASEGQSRLLSAQKSG